MTKQNVARLSEVAKLAGCSTATVSRTLNNPDLVNVEIRNRVDEAIRTLGYMRNGAARALRSRRSFTIGAVIPTLDHAIYAGLVGALQSTVGDAGYSTIITTSDFRIEQELKRARLLVERGIDGLVLVGHQHNEELYELLQRTGIPYVNTYTYQPDSEHPSVGFDNGAATEKVTKLMLDLGHREFALLVGLRENNDRVEDRIQGAIRALASAGISLPDSRIVEELYTIDGGRQGLRRLLARNNRLTALVCGSDVLAFGAVIECNSQGISVPGQISIAGFDNLELAAHLNPPLTTIEVPAAEMGRKAAAYLLARLKDRSHFSHHALETNLIVRQSVGVP